MSILYFPCNKTLFNRWAKKKVNDMVKSPENGYVFLIRDSKPVCKTIKYYIINSH